jgi:hypothetical protein
VSFRALTVHAPSVAPTGRRAPNASSALAMPQLLWHRTVAPPPTDLRWLSFDGRNPQMAQKRWQ